MGRNAANESSWSLFVDTFVGTCFGVERWASDQCVERHALARLAHPPRSESARHRRLLVSRTRLLPEQTACVVAYARIGASRRRRRQYVARLGCHTAHASSAT